MTAKRVPNFGRHLIQVIKGAMRQLCICARQTCSRATYQQAHFSQQGKYFYLFMSAAWSLSCLFEDKACDDKTCLSNCAGKDCHSATSPSISAIKLISFLFFSLTPHVIIWEDLPFELRMARDLQQNQEYWNQHWLLCHTFHFPNLPQCWVSLPYIIISSLFSRLISWMRLYNVHLYLRGFIFLTPVYW